MNLRAGQSLKQRLLANGLILFIIVAAAGAGLAAHAYNRQVTAALILVFGVVLVASRGGLRVGLFAGLLFSLFYNLFLTDPYLQFGFADLADLDDLFPLVAFISSAVASAYVAGRLRDEAKASKEAGERIRSLFELGQELQRTIELRSMVEAAAKHCRVLEFIELHLSDGTVISQGERVRGTGLAFQADLFEGGSVDLGDGRTGFVERFRGGTVIGVSPGAWIEESSACVALLAIAAERWALTQGLMKANLLQRSEEFKTSLLSSLSHDLRTPLSVISASATSLLRYGKELPPETQADLLETIQHHSERLDRLTGKLLSLGRIEGGLSQAKMPVVDVLEVLGSALRSIRPLAANKKIEKTLEVRSALARADPSLLEQVFLNVIENAIVHTPEGCTISVSARSADSILSVHIDDDGRGIPQSEAEVVFNRFSQGSVASSAGGSGLGLSIARGFARAIGGEVALNRKPDASRGARFTITLPLLERPKSDEDAAAN